ncbi:gephyrin-like molybdotransferase Glp [Terriglobus saanensis]|uniref:Molybdopterin molybdenumtransferase n=1 Tax=Terriglobus saanensis (strain ATCC BAA-1853 / DSM 23119 / SP1PR4) TaxID=401053 RepID=E8UYU9_TERSS|nr:gephyrin-like molybdotransferase Glp [Terriglobus saanensis]ADV84315.1 molybdenum cofactor synthesis domain protein [Terriglobus saanensis SP1PR4]
MSDLLTCAQALAVVQNEMQDRVSPVRVSETVPLGDSLGRVLAQPLAADRDQPPFPRSTRDGFAVRSSDAGTRTILGTIRAGKIWTGPALQQGQAIEIMTGAPLPDGADAVIMIEHVSISESTLHLDTGRTLTAGENVVPRAAEASEGDVLLTQGIRLHAAEIALAASLGYATVEVYLQPRVAILATGDELVDVSQKPATHQIRNSNTHGLATLVRAYGGIPVPFPPVADTREALETAIDQTKDADLLLLSGGVSAGKYDFVEPALLARGGRFFFTGIKMQPGKPVVFGQMPSQYVFGLPGNPISTQVTFLLLVAPLLRALGGEAYPTPHFAQATLAKPVKTKPGLTRFLPAILTPGLDKTTVTLTGWQGSGDLASNARANCYAVIPPDRESLAEGEAITVLLR